MKNLIISFLATALVFSACNAKSDKANTGQDTVATRETRSDTAKQTESVSPAEFSIKEILNNYLKLKNALTKDDTKTAAEAARAIVHDLNEMDPNSLPPDQKQSFLDIAGDATEHAEHIRDNASNIEHQREHFAILSKDVNDLLKTFPAGQKLYQDFCPMYNDGKGAIWLSETKEIKNPYYGSKMLTCGSVKKEL